MRAVYIYTLADPETGFVRYVGKTYDVKGRYRWHLRDESGNRKSAWIKSLKARGLVPAIEVIEETDEENWQESERFWIASFKQMGCRLVNADSGGMGCKTISLESRMRMSVSQTGKRWTPEQRAKFIKSMTGRKFSEEAKRKISASNTGKKLTDEHRRKLSLAKIGKPLSDAATAALRTANRSKKMPAWFGEFAAKMNRERVWTQESKAKVGAATRARFANGAPQKHRDATSRYWKGRPKSEQHKKNISEALRKRNESARATGAGRESPMKSARLPALKILENGCCLYSAGKV